MTRELERSRIGFNVEHLKKAPGVLVDSLNIEPEVEVEQNSDQRQTAAIQSTRTAGHYLVTFWISSAAFAGFLVLLPSTARAEQFFGPILFYLVIVGHHLHSNWRSGTFTDLFLHGNQEFKIVTGWICDEVTWQGPISDVTRLVHQTYDDGEGISEAFLVEVRNLGVLALYPWNAEKFTRFSELTGIPIEHLELPSQPLVGLLWSDLKRHIEQRLPDAQV